MATKKHDWVAIRTEYVECPIESARPTLAQLAQKYNINPSAVRTEAARDGWKRDADTFIASLLQKKSVYTDKALDVLAEQLASFDMSCLELSKALNLHIKKHLLLLKESKKLLAIRSLESMARSLKSTQQIGRIALDADFTEERMISHLQRKGYAVTDPTAIQAQSQHQKDPSSEPSQPRTIIIPPADRSAPDRGT